MLDLHGRVLSGSPRNHPVIEATLHLVAATAPTLHPIFAAAVDLDADAVMSGFNDLLPKPWPERFREMQANGGSVEIKSLRLAQGKAIIVVGAGKLALNQHGQLDGVMQVAIVGLDQIVPQLGLGEMLAQGIDRLSGTPGTAAQGLNALDQLIPGLGGALRSNRQCQHVDNLKKMGQPTTVESQAGHRLAAALRRRRDLSRYVAGWRRATAILRPNGASCRYGASRTTHREASWSRRNKA